MVAVAASVSIEPFSDFRGLSTCLFGPASPAPFSPRDLIPSVMADMAVPGCSFRRFLQQAALL